MLFKMQTSNCTLLPLLLLLVVVVVVVVKFISYLSHAETNAQVGLKAREQSTKSDKFKTKIMNLSTPLVNYIHHTNHIDCKIPSNNVL